MSFFVLMASHLGAESALKVGYVNYEAAVAQEHEAKEILTKLENEEKGLQAAEQKARTELEAEVEKFHASAGKLDEKTRNAQQVALGNKANTVQQQLHQNRLKAEQNQQAEQKELLKKNQLLVDHIAKEGKYDLVLNSAAIVYASDNIKKNDLTQALATKYNATYAKKPEASKKKADSEATKKKQENTKKETKAPASNKEQ